MFHFPTFPPHALYIQTTVTGHNSSWVTPFGHPRINARLPTPQGLSQAPTSFIGSRCQGIHRMLLVACHNTTRLTQKQDARVHYAVLKTQAETPPNPPPTRITDPAVWCKRGPQEKPNQPPKGRPDFSGPNSVPRHPTHHPDLVPRTPTTKERDAVLDDQERRTDA